MQPSDVLKNEIPAHWVAGAQPLVRTEAEHGLFIEIENDDGSKMSAVSNADKANSVHTTRYNVLNWFPKALWQQFRKAANLFFMFVGVSLVLGGCPPRGAGMAVTFAITLVVNIVIDLVEDLARRRDDHHENTRRAKVYRHTCCDGLVEKEWQDCQVGDIVVISCDEAIPADLVIVASSDPDGVCFVSTASLDGETNLKRLYVEPFFKTLHQSSDASDLDWAQECYISGIRLTLKPPSRHLMSMDGRYSLGNKIQELQIDNFLLRGMVLRNTDWVLGVVCFVGKDTKIMLNSSATPSKFSDLHFALNKVIGCFLIYILALCIYISVGAFVVGGAPRPQGNGILCETSNFAVVLWRSVLVFYPLVPVTLYLMAQISKELCKKGINQDILMQRDADSQKACMRTCDLVTEIGQVSVVFSDKTGTLTANEMHLKACCVGETLVDSFANGRFSKDEDAIRNIINRTGDSAHNFFLALTLCNDVKVGREGEFQSESPDEVALVEAAKSMGFILQSRQATPQGIECCIKVLGVDTSSYHVSHTLAFTSDRKRMSVILPRDGGGALVLTKGADAVMEGLLALPLSTNVADLNRMFSKQGYRNLVVAARVMDDSAYRAWCEMWSLASSAADDREEKLKAAAASAEQNLQYVGLSIVEDRLQDGVPESIATIRNSGIKFWMLTGDKVETAVAIASSAALITNQMRIIRVTGGQSPEDAVKAMSNPSIDYSKPCALVLDGPSLLHILSDPLARRTLYLAGMRSEACVCCRLSPMQKRELVELVNSFSPETVTLAIGDGANDVPMIQGAKVGIGIRGKEGTAAVQASDVVLTQFRFLRNLLFCHGRKAYRRISTYLLWYLYHQLVASWANVLHATENGFQASSCWPGNLEDPMNLIEFFAFVVFFCEKDIEDTDAIKAEFASTLYPVGPDRLLFNFWQVGKWLAFGTWHGIVAWMIPMIMLTTAEDRTVIFDEFGHAKPPSRGFWSASITAWTVITIIIYTKLAITVRKNLSLVGLCTIIGIFCFYPLVLALLVWNVPCNPFYTKELADGVAFVMFTSLPHALCTITVPFLALLPDMADVVYESCCEIDRKSLATVPKQTLTRSLSSGNPQLFSGRDIGLSFAEMSEHSVELSPMRSNPIAKG